MVDQLVRLGLAASESCATAWLARRHSGRPEHPLAAYPTLLAAFTSAEKSGALAAERRRLASRRAR